jgi:hypothetical protein
MNHFVVRKNFDVQQESETESKIQNRKSKFAQE